MSTTLKPLQVTPRFKYQHKTKIFLELISTNIFPEEYNKMIYWLYQNNKLPIELNEYNYIWFPQNSNICNTHFTLPFIENPIVCSSFLKTIDRLFDCWLKSKRLNISNNVIKLIYGEEFKQPKKLLDEELTIYYNNSEAYNSKAINKINDNKFIRENLLSKVFCFQCQLNGYCKFPMLDLDCIEWLYIVTNKLHNNNINFSLWESSKNKHWVFIEFLSSDFQTIYDFVDVVFGEYTDQKHLHIAKARGNFYCRAFGRNARQFFSNLKNPALVQFCQKMTNHFKEARTIKFNELIVLNN